MEDIKENEYIRTYLGEIGRVIAIKENPDRVVIDDCGQIVLIADITKHSFNLIDLIEVGDYVNGNIVTDKYLFAGEKPVIETERNDTNCKCLCEKDIKSILTHEVFEANAYKVKGE